jgi:hypothetical protein
MKITTGLVVSVMLGALCCNAQTRQDRYDTSAEAPKGELAKFANLLNAEGTPGGSSKTMPDLFFDLGAWHGFGLPDRQNLQHQGGFTGPFALVDQRGWVSPELVHLSLKRVENGNEIALSGTTSSTEDYYPGFLAETYDTGDVSVAMRLWCLSSRSAIVSARISNKSTRSSLRSAGTDQSMALVIRSWRMELVYTLRCLDPQVRLRSPFRRNSARWN